MTSTILAAAAEEAASAGATLTITTGSGITQALAPDELTRAAALAAAADFTLLVVGTGQLIEAEGLDRSTLLLPPCQQALLYAVSAAATPARLIIAVVSAGGVDLGAPIASIAGAYIIAGYGGEETGHGLWDVLSGRVSPSGRLPITHYKESYLAAVAPIADFNLVSVPGGVGRTYRYVNDSFVLFHFGTGLSYSTFAYSNLTIALQVCGDCELWVRYFETLFSSCRAQPNGSLTGSVLVQNTGAVDAYEIVQVCVQASESYVAHPANTPITRLFTGVRDGPDRLWARDARLRPQGLCPRMAPCRRRRQRRRVDSGALRCPRSCAPDHTPRRDTRYDARQLHCVGERPPSDGPCGVAAE